MTVEIHKGEIVSLEKSGSRWGLKTLHGTIWLTQANDEHDYVLREGACAPPLADGKVVIEALSENVKIELSSR